MSVASHIIASCKKRTPLQEAFDIKILGIDESSQDFYVSVGGISYKYIPKNDADMTSAMKNFYRESYNPAKALADLKKYATPEKVEKVPSNLTVIKSVKDIDNLGSVSQNVEK